MLSPSLPILLRTNATFSAATGAASLLAATPLAGALDAPVTIVAAVGGGLLAFAAGLAILSRGPADHLSGWGRAVAAADATWVVGSVALLTLHRPPPSGTALVVCTSSVVLILAVAQLRASRRVEGRDIRVIEVARVVAGDPDALWTVMTDGELYGRLALNLSKVAPFTTGVDGTPEERRCWDRMGQHWDETCTAWRAGESYSVRVHTDAPDYPYPLSALRGTWSVEPEAIGRSRITVRFELEPRPGAAGRAFAATMAASGPAIIKRIIAGWAKEAAVRSVRTDAAADGADV